MKLLIIEDEYDIVKFLKPSLESECFAVDVSGNGEEGAFMACTKDYDMIILDNMLPKKDGMQVCRDIRRINKTTPIIILSVIENIDKKVDLLNAGADDYMTKPFSFDELLARIRALLRRPKKIQDDIFTIGELVINTRKHTARKGEDYIHLTKKEFMLIEYMMRNPGIVISRGMLLEHIWDMNADPFSNTIEAHITSVRRKIGNINGKKLIHTIPGRGYKLIAD